MTVAVAAGGNELRAAVGGPAQSGRDGAAAAVDGLPDGDKGPRLQRTLLLQPIADKASSCSSSSYVSMYTNNSSKVPTTRALLESL